MRGGESERRGQKVDGIHNVKHSNSVLYASLQ